MNGFSSYGDRKCQDYKFLPLGIQEGVRVDLVLHIVHGKDSYCANVRLAWNISMVIDWDPFVYLLRDFQ